MNYFFYPSPLSEGDAITLAEQEGRHAAKVLRLSTGDVIHIINGLGQLGEGEISNMSGDKVGVIIKEVKTETKPMAKLTIALATLKKKDRLEWFVEKAVELAADKIILFSSQHTEKDKTDINRLNKIAVSALKQSGNLWMPEIVANIGFQDVISLYDSGSKFIAHCREGQKQPLADAYKATESTLVLIGPEGDFSEGEIKLAHEKNFVPVSLGNLRLRAETAALTALITLRIAGQNRASTPI